MVGGEAEAKITNGNFRGKKCGACKFTNF